MTVARASRTLEASDVDDGDVEVGDVLLFLGNPHQVTALEPYTHSDGSKGHIAYAAAGFAFVLYERQAR